MRSLWYLLTRRPVNLDDHLDFLAGRTVEKVTLQLNVQTFASEFVIANHLVAQVRLYTRDKTYAVEVLCGGYLEGDSENRKLRGLHQANRKLKACLVKLRSAHILVEDCIYDTGRYPAEFRGAMLDSQQQPAPSSP